MRSPLLRRLALAYGPSFAALYMLASARDLPLFTVYPTQMRVALWTGHSLGATPSAVGAPTMHWYGWMATAAVGALLLSLLAASLRARWTRRIWPGWLWVIPLLAMAASVCLELTAASR